MEVIGYQEIFLGDDQAGAYCFVNGPHGRNHMPASIRTFEDLECWKSGRELRMFVARQVVPVLPREEKNRLGDQLLRSARSITANIAEGYGRFHYLDNSKFCSNARGSCCEVLDHLIIANDEGLIAEELLAQGRGKVATTLRLVNGYMAYLKRAAATNNH